MKIQRYDESSFIVIAHQGRHEDDNTTYLRKDGTVAPCVEDDETDGYWDTYAEAEAAVRAYTRALARARRRAVDDVMSSLGLAKVRGALGGTYYE